MVDIDGWLCKYGCLPSTHSQLLLLELGTMAAFAVVALALAIAYAVLGRGTTFAASIIYIARSGVGNGGAFPVAVLFCFYPISAHVRDLFSFDQALIALVVGSATVALLQLYALLKGP